MLPPPLVNLFGLQRSRNKQILSKQNLYLKHNSLKWPSLLVFIPQFAGLYLSGLIQALKLKEPVSACLDSCSPIDWSAVYPQWACANHQKKLLVSQLAQLETDMPVKWRRLKFTMSLKQSELSMTVADCGHKMQCKGWMQTIQGAPWQMKGEKLLWQNKLLLVICTSVFKRKRRKNIYI